MARAVLEAGDGAGAPGEIGAEDLHRQPALEVRVHHLIHLREAPAADHSHHAELAAEREGEAIELAGIAGGPGVERGKLGAEERETARPAAGAVRGALAQECMAGRADQYRQRASGGQTPAASLKINA